jgi:hypothetical protein
MSQPLAPALPAPPLAELLLDLKTLLLHLSPGQCDYLVAFLAWAADAEEGVGEE